MVSFLCPIGQVTPCCAPLGDHFEAQVPCSSMVNESIRLKIHEGKRRIAFIFEPFGVARHSDRHQIEFWIAAVMRACRQITRRHVTAKSITFAHPRKPTPELNRFFGSKITFRADLDEVAFSPSIKSIPIISADTYLNDLLVHYCEEALKHQRNRGLIGTRCRLTPPRRDPTKGLSENYLYSR